ncbi:DUF4947 domain-containing protein [Streptococcus sanguinis]|jgi:hypothetical protein|uniref:DUF4947 domain-containing protein n=1 Tax=Streptococcus sanguinis TaxID=1305 RepID=UPI0039C2747F
MKKRTLFSLFSLVAALFLLSACSLFLPQRSNRPAQSSEARKIEKKDSSSKKKSETKESSSSSSSSQDARKEPEKTTDGLPADADHAKKDKIYATGDAKVYYQSYESGGFEAQIPEFKGYTQEKVKSILGEPEKVSTDLASEYEAFQNKELENLKRLVQEQKINTEQARAFLAGVVDISQASRLQNTYTIYFYKNEQISIIFSQEGELLYVTPDPDYLYFK